MTKLEYRIESYDVQPNGYVKLSSLMRILQELAGNDLDGSNLTYMNLYHHNCAFVITKFTLQLLDNIKMYDRIVVETYPRPVRGISFQRDFIIFRDGVRVGLSSTVWCLIDLQKRSILCPDALDGIGTFPTTTENPFSLPFVRRKIDKNSLSRTNVRETYYSELDMNGHLNNTFYADIVFDSLPDADKIQMKDLFFEINFKNESRLGEKLIINTTDPECDEIDILAVKESDEQPCFSAYLNKKSVYNG